MRWPRPHMSDGLLGLMDSWFYPWWLRIACSVYAKKYKNILIYSNVIWVSPCFGYLRIQIPRDVSQVRVTGIPNGILISLGFGSMFRRHQFSQRTLGSKSDPCQHRAGMDHACHSSYTQYFVPWTGIPANKMASCDCLKVALCDQFVHKKTLHAHGKCCMYKSQVLKAGGFCLCDHWQSQ